MDSSAVVVACQVCGWAGDGTNGPIVYTTTTAADGSYSFPSLPDGDFVVTVDESTLPTGVSTRTVDPEGDDDGDSEITALSGGSTVTTDFGYTGDGSISGAVLHDIDGNGTGDAPLDGVTVIAEWDPDGVPGNGDEVEYTTVTDAAGVYNFPGLPAGDYTVDVDEATLPTGVDAATLDPTADTDGTTDGVAAITLGDAEDLAAQDFAYTGTATIEGDVLHDVLGDGSTPDDVDLAGITVTATWDPDAIPGSGDEVDYAAVTDASGHYAFAGLPAGDYTLDVDESTLPTGLDAPTFDAAADTDGSANGTASITLTDGEDLLGQDFGYTGTGSISGSVLHDVLGNGITGDDVNLAGITVTATWDPDGIPGNGDEILYAAITDATGGYSFSNLPAGAYTVDVDEATLPSGLDVPSVDASADGDGSVDGVASVTLGDAETLTDQTFAYTGAGSIQGEVRHDVLADGVSGDDLDLTGIAVTAEWDPDGIPANGDEILYTGITDAAGAYSFAGLPAGTYTIDVDESTLPDGLDAATFDPIEDVDGAVNGVAEIPLADGEDLLGQLFGYTGTGQIDGSILHDILGDGAGADDLPLGGITVSAEWDPDGIPASGDEVLYSTVTDAAGSYSFPNLPAGDYTIDPDESGLIPGITVGTFDAAGDTDGSIDGAAEVALGVDETLSG